MLFIETKVPAGAVEDILRSQIQLWFWFEILSHSPHAMCLTNLTLELSFYSSSHYVHALFSSKGTNAAVGLVYARPCKTDTHIAGFTSIVTWPLKGTSLLAITSREQCSQGCCKSGSYRGLWCGGSIRTTDKEAWCNQEAFPSEGSCCRRAWLIPSVLSVLVAVNRKWKFSVAYCQLLST